MNLRVILYLLLAISIVIGVLTTYLRIPMQDYQGLSNFNRDATQVFHGKNVATTINTLNQVNEKCQNVLHESYWKTLKPTGLVWYYGNLNVYYCIVPKVGCTYWKRVIRFVSQDYPQSMDIRTPSDIDRHFVHAGKHPQIQEFKINDKAKRDNMTNRAFMFVRDPYARLWSAYLDKLFLPDFFVLNRRYAQLVRSNMTGKELGCVADLSFQEFLTAITKIWPKQLNRHWEPIHLLCSPCLTKYAAIGKIENFAEDNTYILEKFGIHWNNITTTSKRRLAFEEIQTLTEYNFEIVVLKHNECLNKLDLAKRLWKTFQYNGYIDRYTPFPAAEFTNITTTSQAIQTFLEIAERTLDRQTNLKDVTSQKRTMMLEAYKKMPTELLDEIKNIYKYDFELFGYEKDLFK